MRDEGPFAPLRAVSRGFGGGIGFSAVENPRRTENMAGSGGRMWRLGAVAAVWMVAAAAARAGDAYGWRVATGGAPWSARDARGYVHRTVCSFTIPTLPLAWTFILEWGRQARGCATLQC